MYMDNKNYVPTSLSNSDAKKQIKSIKEKTDRPNLFLEKREQKKG